MYHGLTVLNFLAILFLLVIVPLGAHEAGHWAVLKKYKVPVKEFWLGLGPSILHIGKFRIGLFPLGAAVVPDPILFEKIGPAEKIWVAVAGPLFSFAAAILFYSAPLYWSTYSNLSVLKMAGDLNLFIGAFNLLPIPPLDGFQIFLNWHYLRDKKLHPDKVRIAYRLGNGILYGVGFFLIMKMLLIKL